MRSNPATCVLLLIATLGICGCEQIVDNKRRRQAYAEMEMFREAILAYRIEYSVLPLPAAEKEVQSNRDLYAMLHAPAGPTAGNPKGIAFIDAPLGSVVKGEFVDPWGPAYSVAIDHDGDGFVAPGGQRIQEAFAIWSSGKNGADEGGGGDDLCSWR